MLLPSVMISNTYSRVKRSVQFMSSVHIGAILLFFFFFFEGMTQEITTQLDVIFGIRTSGMNILNCIEIIQFREMNEF